MSVGGFGGCWRVRGGVGVGERAHWPNDTCDGGRRDGRQVTGRWDPVTCRHVFCSPVSMTHVPVFDVSLNDSLNGFTDTHDVVSP